MPAANTYTDRVIKLTEVAHLVSLSKATIWRLRRAGTFPKSRCVSPGRVGWLQSEIIAWIDSRGTQFEEAQRQLNALRAEARRRGRRRK